MENKMTYVMAIDNALEVVVDKATREKLEALKVQLNKKSKSGSSKPTKRQVENAEVIVPAIVSYLATVESATPTEIAKNVASATGLEVSTSRVTAQLTTLKKSEKVVNVKTSKGSFYSLV